MTNLNADSANDTPRLKTLSQLQDSACMVGGLLDGLDVLFGSIDERGAMNAIFPLIAQTRALNDQLTRDLDGVNAHKLDLTDALANQKSQLKRIAGGMVAPSVEQHESEQSVSALVSRWKSVRAAQIGLAATMEGANSEPPALKALEDENEAICRQIAERKPTSNQEAADMLEWAEIDSDGEIFDPMYQKARMAVIEYIRSS